MKLFRLFSLLFCFLLLLNCRNDNFDTPAETQISVKIHDDYKMSAVGQKDHPDYIPLLNNTTFDFTAQTQGEGSYWQEINGEIEIYLQSKLPNNKENSVALFFDKNSNDVYEFTTANLGSLMMQDFQQLNQIPGSTGVVGSNSLVIRPKTATVNFTIKNGILSGKIIDLKTDINYSQTFMYDGTIPQIITVTGILQGTSFRTYNFTIENLAKQ